MCVSTGQSLPTFDAVDIAIGGKYLPGTTIARYPTVGKDCIKLDKVWQLLSLVNNLHVRC